ncbi:m-AAA protease-interacting protein 1, mitochondrial [Eupeodes corollae]|uniref:m-AAA protease-interacting protein 1, mitochondrial n=1 Tax=Eupeodes corollae TaxID=290404 RepID=UPI00248F7AD8|nr:m-AAA protease-interacting protein 1, mitochondrial [Eupeodes corollae]
MSSLAAINLNKYLFLSRRLLAQNILNKNKCFNSNIIPKESSALCSMNQHAYFSSHPNPSNESKRQRSLPSLMQFPEILWPSFINTIRNWVLINFIIRPYFDNEFNLKDFIYGTKHAVHTISTKLVNSNLTELKNLVSQEAIDEIKPVIETLSVSQRKQLEINKDDIYLSFPYQVGIMFDESNEKIQKRFVEITMVFHVLKGFREMQNQGEVLPWNMGSLPEYEDKVFICNYRFIKEFTAGNQTDWTVNVINHFKPLDLMINE